MTQDDEYADCLLGMLREAHRKMDLDGVPKACSLPPYEPRGGRRRCARTDEQTEVAVFRLRESGLTWRAIGKQLGLNQATVGRILERKVDFPTRVG